MTEKLVVGLMSGTSCDGVDAAIVGLDFSKNKLKWDLKAFQTYPYPANFKAYLIKITSTELVKLEHICRLNFILGEFFSASALKIIKENHFQLTDIYLIGSHGHTLYHCPPEVPEKSGSTFQIGESAVISAKLGLPVISNFREADLSVGGQGAPLVPYVDYLLFNHEQKNRILLNIGGIANLTFLKANGQPDEVIAFDTGPGNCLIDLAAYWASEGKSFYDKNGTLASKGSVSEEILSKLLAFPYFEKLPPKSTGKELFGQSFFDNFLKIYDPYLNSERAKERDLIACDMIATLTAFTAKSITDAIKRIIVEKAAVDEIIISGGGVHNKTLMKMISDYTAEVIKILTSESFGIPVDAKEALAFAILAFLTDQKQTSNLPSVTGASKKVLLGKITPTISKAK